MPSLKSRTVTRIEVDYNDFDRFVSEVYGHSYEFVADIECDNYSQHSYSVAKRELNQWDLAKLNEFNETGQGSGLISVLFTDMANRYILPEGNYIISVFW